METKILSDFIKKLPITTFILVFLYVCGTLYLIAYWSTFGVDISNIVGITEIPKSFVFPFVLSQTIFFIQLLLDTVVSSGLNLDREKFSYDEKKGLWHILLKSNDFHIAIIFTAITGLFGILKQTILYWIISGILLSGVLVIKVILLPISKKFFTNYTTRRFIAIIIIYTPIICVALGKVNSLFIYKNIHVTYVNPIANDASKQIFSINDSTKSKLLGFLGDKVIISSLDNKNVYVLNQSAFDVIELQEKKR